MVSLSLSHCLEQDTLDQDSIYDTLYCEEERFEEVLYCGFVSEEPEIEHFVEKPVSVLFEHDLLWDDDEILCLLSKEKIQDFDVLESDLGLVDVRREGIKWMLNVIAYYGFNAITAVLAVNYYDRFISSPCFQKDKPWMSQLAVVACLSIAAKVEETQVPLLLDLQVEAKYVFEAKTIQRMELMVLSTLKWKMNPVTPISFFDHIVRRFGLMNDLHLKFLRRFESVILSVITDCRLMRYLPSVIAAAIITLVLREIEPCTAMEYQNQLMNVLKVDKEMVNECYKHILEIVYDPGYKTCHKRSRESIPSSPNGVMDAYFSSDSSNDSWAVAFSVSSSPEPLFKRSRAQDQHRRLAPLSSVSIGVGCSPS